jgi:hypothetical protein
MFQVSVESMLTRYSLVSMLFVVGICIIAGTWKSHAPSILTSNRFSMKLKQHLLVPAAYNGRHLSPLPYRIGVLHQRQTSLDI